MENAATMGARGAPAQLARVPVFEPRHLLGPSVAGQGKVTWGLGTLGGNVHPLRTRLWAGADLPTLLP